MAVVARWGGRNFEVSPNKIHTFTGYMRKASYRTTPKNQSGKKPLTTNNGPDLGTLNIDITLDAGMGLNPGPMIDGWIADCEKGRVDYFLLGGVKHGADQWKLMSVSVTDPVIDNRGKILRAKLNLNFTEYYVNPPKKKKPTKKSVKNSKK